MLNTSSTILTGNETFSEAFQAIPDTNDISIRYLKTDEGLDAGYYQAKIDGVWQAPKKCKADIYGNYLPANITNSKSKLSKASIFYDTFTKPTHAGGNSTQSWMVGDIDNCNILGDDYNIQGMIISTVFDPTPKYYISFERIVCENQFSRLGQNTASMYIDMSKFLTQSYSIEAKEKLQNIISNEAEQRIEEAKVIYDKLASTHLTDEQIKSMFRRLTVDTVAKANKERYDEQEKRYNNYLKVYDNNDNQNFKGSLFGFVNACTNISTRERKNPLDVIKPALPADVINNPCNFEYLCRSALLQNVAA